MIKVEKIEVTGWESAIRGMRNPLQSWHKSDSYDIGFEKDDGERFISNKFRIGRNDLKLMQKLVKAGSDHAKFMRFINVTMNITAPLYWWKEFDTYKVGTIANSCSTMHTIHKKEFILDDFSCEYLDRFYHLSEKNLNIYYDPVCYLSNTLKVLNALRDEYLRTKDKKLWYMIIQLLPSSYNQKRTVQLNYEVIRRMYFARKDHKLDEWKEFCSIMIDQLPYFDKIIGIQND